MNKILKYTIVTIVLVGLVVLQRQFLPKTVEVVNTIMDTNELVLHQQEVKTLQLQKDSLDSCLQDSKRIIKKILIAKPQIITVAKVDTVIPVNYIKVEDCLNTISRVEYKTIYKDTCITKPVTISQPTVNQFEDFILYKRYKKHKIRFDKEQFVEGDSIKLLSGDNDEVTLLNITNINDIPKKLKTDKTYCVHITANSINKGIENRIYEIMKF